MEDMTNVTEANYSILAVHMVNPHFGQANGLIRPNHWAQGIEGTCACPLVPAEVEASNVLDKTPVVRVASGQGGIAENMEEAAEEDLEDLAAGASPQATKFHKAANAVTMLPLVKGEYCEDLLSNRLQGRVIKEALAISLLSQFCEENPSPSSCP